jgi:hypothetical protein
MDIVVRQPRVIYQDCLKRHASAEFTEDQLNRNTGTANDRLANHDSRIDFDAFMNDGVSLDLMILADRSKAARSYLPLTAHPRVEPARMAMIPISGTRNWIACQRETRIDQAP